VWGGAVARLLIWHTTFCINSLAHWTGLQPYTQEVTARGNYLIALLTSGEGNHNFHHAFPKDFRNGPHPADWDPTKWIIYLLHKYTPFVPTIARTSDAAIVKARARSHMAEADRLFGSVKTDALVKNVEDLPVWTVAEIRRRHGEWVRVGEERRRRVLVLVDGCVVDVGGYLEDHPGGQYLLMSHSVFSLPPTSSLSPSSSMSDFDSRPPSPLIDSGYSSASGLSRKSFKSQSDSDDLDDERVVPALRDATKAFNGGMNNHSGAAKEILRCLRVARLDPGAK